MKTIVVRVSKAAEDPALVAKLHDVAEDLYGEFGLGGIAQLPEDSFTTEFRVMVPATRDLGIVSQFLKKAVRRHGLTELAEISRADLL